MQKVVIIGAGQAGFSAADRLRRKGFEGSITLLGDEPAPPYQRPPLSKAYLTGDMARERLFFRPESYYGEQNIQLVTGTAAAAIDRETRTVTAGGQTYPYDALLLSTGAIPRRLPEAIGGHLPRVYTVRTLADVDAMAEEFAKGRRALIIGGGYIGLEAAAVASKRGLTVTLLEAAERILGRVACAETASALRDLHTGHGVTIREGCALTAIRQTGNTLTADLAGGGTVEADFVITGIGIAPDTRLAEAAGLTVENGILTDAACRTSDPAIFAAGDCAIFPHNGRMLRLESVGGAIDMAEAAADAMLGETVSYTPKPWFWSDQYDITLQIAGLNTGYASVITRPGEREGAISFWYFDGAGQLLSVDAISDARAYMMGKRWIEAGKSPSPEAIADPAQPLKTIAVA